MNFNQVDTIIEKMLAEAKDLREDTLVSMCEGISNQKAASTLENYAFQLESIVECLILELQDRP